MKKLIAILLAEALLFLGVAAFGQSQTTFTWTGSTDASQLVELSTINGQPVDQSGGYAGAVQIVNRNFLWLLTLPSPVNGVTLPNNGFLDCSSAITWGAKRWGTRADGTVMDGTKAGDSYVLAGNTTCTLADGIVQISLLEQRHMIQLLCRYGRPCPFLTDTMTGGSGTATVE